MDAKRTLRLVLLHGAKALGLFALARLITRDRLRILAYHGGSLLDEHEFRPGLFMTGATFEARMRFLVARQYPVLTLDEALARLAAGTLPANATVITIDDGWYGTYRLMVPVLEALGLPATLYVATYYLEKQTQVFNVAVAYVLWAARRGAVDFGATIPDLSGVRTLELAADREEVQGRIEAYAATLPGAAARQELLRALCRATGVDAISMESARQFAFMSAAEAAELPGRGVDLQLHTHRHRFPDATQAAAEAEISDNRAVLEQLTSRPLRHFCYPSGHYSRGQLPWLPMMGIVSAVTTDPGLNNRESPPGELSRILDSEVLTMIEFESEISGFRDLFR